MKIFFLVFLYLFVALAFYVYINRADADDVGIFNSPYRPTAMIFDLGIGIFNSASQSPTETKYFTFSFQENLWKCFKLRESTGLWIDNTGLGRNSSGFISAQAGVEIDNNGWVASVFTGPAFMTTPDVMLGSYLEFYHTLSFGLHDKDYNYIGMVYHHLSNASISSYNLGRDLLGLELKFPF